MKLTWLVCISLLALAAVGAWAGDLVNGGFEEGFRGEDSWIMANHWGGMYSGGAFGTMLFYDETSDTRTGSHSQGLGASVSDLPCYITQTVDVIPGQWYMVSAWVKPISGHASLYLSEWAPDVGMTRGPESIATPTGDWVLLQQSMQANASSSMEIHIMCYKDSDVDGRMLVDDVTFSLVPEPSSVITLLCGIGGMGGMIWRRKSA